MKLEKNLANCTPKEFLVQTNKIRKSVKNWFEVTDIMTIRKNVPKLDIPADATEDEAAEIMAKYKQDLKKAARKNIMDMLDSILDEHPDETVELLALLCFVDPSNVNDYGIVDYLNNITEIISDEDVLSFFTSLTRLGQTGILRV